MWFLKLIYYDNAIIICEIPIITNTNASTNDTSTAAIIGLNNKSIPKIISKILIKIEIVCNKRLDLSSCVTVNIAKTA